MKLYDSIIVGAGPAGLSAAIYLARFNRSVLVVDNGFGRSSHHQVNENYLGFPEGIHAAQLRELGKKQAERFGVEFKEDKINRAEKIGEHFIFSGDSSDYEAKTVIIATGVTDKFPLFQERDECIGKSLFWCITCDGYKTKDKRIIIVGRDNESVVTALQFMLYTNKITFLTNTEKGKTEITPPYKNRLDKHAIPFIEGCIASVGSHNGHMHKITLDTDEVLEADLVFSLQGAVPNSYLAIQLGVAVNEYEYIKTDLEQRTNIPRVYAAGDVTRNFSHQVGTAVHEGSMAAQAANYDLYTPDQRHG